MSRSPTVVSSFASVGGLRVIDSRPITLPEFRISEQVRAAKIVHDRYGGWILLHQNAGWTALIALFVLVGVAFTLLHWPITLAYLVLGGLAGIVLCTGVVLFLVSHWVTRKPTVRKGGIHCVRVADTLQRLAWRYEEMRQGCCRVLAEHDAAQFTMAVVLQNLVSAQNAFQQGRAGDAEFHCGLVRDGLDKVAECKSDNGAHPGG